MFSLVISINQGGLFFVPLKRLAHKVISEMIYNGSIGMIFCLLCNSVVLCIKPAAQWYKSQSRHMCRGHVSLMLWRLKLCQ